MAVDVAEGDAAQQPHALTKCMIKDRWRMILINHGRLPGADRDASRWPLCFGVGEGPMPTCLLIGGNVLQPVKPFKQLMSWASEGRCLGLQRGDVSTVRLPMAPNEALTLTKG